MNNMSSGEKNRCEPNSQSEGQTSHIPASEGLCERLKNEDLGEEFRDIAVAEQLTNLWNARAPGAEPFYGCHEAYSDLGHIQEEGLDDYPEDAPDPLYINYLPPPKRIPNGLLTAVRIFPFAVDDESRELHFWANGVTLATEDRHGNATYYHSDATIRIEEPNPGAAVEVPRRGRTNEMRNRLFLVDVDEDGPFIKRTRDRDLDPNMTLEEMDAFVCELIDQPMESNKTFRTYTIKKRNNGIVVVQQDTKPERVEPGTQQLKINMDRQRSEGTAKKGSETDENSEDDLTKYESDPQAPD